MEKRKKIEILAEYELPYLGKAKLLTSSFENNMTYWVNLESYCANFGITDKGIDDSLRKASQDIFLLLIKKRNNLLCEINKINSLLENNNLDEIVAGRWIEKYLKKSSQNK